MQSHFPVVPVYLANDANAAALAELHAGVFKEVKTAILLTLGTGIGGGIILNGRMFNGGMGNGVELGHMVLAQGGPICTCGTRGCLETLCTATWLVQQGRRSIIDYPKALIYTQAGGDLNKVTAKLVLDCAKAGDAIARGIFERYVDQLGSRSYLHPYTGSSDYRSSGGSPRVNSYLNLTRKTFAESVFMNLTHPSSPLGSETTQV
jgi:predicted NBD/HSP70 family sugar kinase